MVEAPLLPPGPSSRAGGVRGDNRDARCRHGGNGGLVEGRVRVVHQPLPEPRSASQMREVDRLGEDFLAQRALPEQQAAEEPGGCRNVDVGSPLVTDRASTVDT